MNFRKEESYHAYSNDIWSVAHKLSSTALNVYLFLRDMPKDWQAIPAQIAKVLGKSVRTIQKALRSLREEGLASFSQDRLENGRFSLSESLIQPVVKNVANLEPVVKNGTSFDRNVKNDARHANYINNYLLNNNYDESVDNSADLRIKRERLFQLEEMTKSLSHRKRAAYNPEIANLRAEIEKAEESIAKSLRKTPSEELKDTLTRKSTPLPKAKSPGSRIASETKRKDLAENANYVRNIIRKKIKELYKNKEVSNPRETIAQVEYAVFNKKVLKKIDTTLLHRANVALKLVASNKWSTPSGMDRSHVVEREKQEKIARARECEESRVMAGILPSQGQVGAAVYG